MKETRRNEASDINFKCRPNQTKRVLVGKGNPSYSFIRLRGNDRKHTESKVRLLQKMQGICFVENYHTITFLS